MDINMKNIRTIRETDHFLEQLWAEFGDIPVDPETEKLEADFHDFPAGTQKEDIWHWFDERYSKGIGHLLYQDGVDRTDDVARYYYRRCLCGECDSGHCIFNPEGICLYPLLYGRKAEVNEEGCFSCVFNTEASHSVCITGGACKQNHPDNTENRTFCYQCKNLSFSDCYGECSKGYKEIVNPYDSCPYAEKRDCNISSAKPDLKVALIRTEGKALVRKYLSVEDAVAVARMEKSSPAYTTGYIWTIVDLSTGWLKNI